MKKQIVIIGGGPGGLAAALAASEEADCQVVILEREPRLGGILNQCIHDGFGLHRFGKMMSGPEYAHRYEELVRRTNVEIHTDTMVIDFAPDRTVKAVNKQGVLLYHPDAVIIATGCRERTRGAIAIPGSRPAGIFTAGVVQSLMNLHNIQVGSRVVILGSGDIGLIMARRLTYEGAKVLAVVELQKEPGGLQRNVSQCLYDFGIPLYVRHTITEIRGKKRVESVVMAQVDDAGKPVPGTEQEIACDTLVLSVGLIPENELAQKAGVALDPRSNGVLVDEHLQTNVPGVFACGNAKKVLDLADYVSREGELAGRNAARLLKGEPMGTITGAMENPMAKGLPPENSLTCILCPNGCQLLWEDGKVTGNRCPRGLTFAQQEREQPMRSLTITLLGENGTLIPARTTAPIPKDRIFEAIAQCRKQKVSGPCHVGDVLIENLLGCGVDLIASADGNGAAQKS